MWIIIVITVEKYDFWNEQAGENYNEYLLMQDRARAHLAKLIFKCWKTRNRSPKLLEPNHWLSNNPDLSPVDFEI